jgi:hypothetical protein
MSQFLLQLLLTLIWKPLGTLCSPLARILSGYVWAGRWFYVFGLHITRIILRLVGWLSASPFAASTSRGDRHDPSHRRHALVIVRLYRHYFGSFDVKRWHLVMGELRPMHLRTKYRQSIGLS